MNAVTRNNMDINCSLFTVLVLAINAPIHACLFGSSEDCTFQCHCASNAFCDVTTGHCPGQCEEGLPQSSDDVTRFDWRGPACQIGNVALNKSADQSGAWQDFVAGNAVDGRLVGVSENENCAHPDAGSGSSAWWRVDLGSIHAIHNVTVYNTAANTGFRRLVEFVIGVGNTTKIAEHTLCASYGSPAVPAGEDVTLTCSSPLYGRFVSFTRTGGFEPHLVTICEFVVMGYKQTYADCDKCTGSCDDIMSCRECSPSYTNAPFCDEERSSSPPLTTQSNNVVHSSPSLSISTETESSMKSPMPTEYQVAAEKKLVIIVLAILFSVSLLVNVVQLAYILRISTIRGLSETHTTPLSAVENMNNTPNGPPSTGEYEGLKEDTRRHDDPNQYAMMMIQKEDGAYENVTEAGNVDREYDEL